MIDLQMTMTGPVFDGRAGKAFDRFMEESKDEVSQEGVNLIDIRLGQVLKNPTGFYQSQVATDRAVDDRQINDSNVVYGPWLEGTGSRNQTTRFKGYHTFRVVTQDLQGDTSRIAESVLRRHLGAMQ